MESFLLTLRLFATPGEVMSLLRKRFAVPLPRDRSNKELQDRYYQAKVFPVRMRVFNMAKLWLDRYNIGCLEDEVFLKEVKELVQIMLDAGMEKVATSLQHVLQRQKEGHNSVACRSNILTTAPPTAPTASLEICPPWTSLQPDDIARQLTLTQQRLYCAIKPWEIIIREKSRRRRKKRRRQQIGQNRRHTAASGFS